MASSSFWICQHCTLHNSVKFNECLACGLENLVINENASTNFGDETADYNWIVSSCKMYKRSFTDDAFPPNNRSIGNFKENNLDVVWLRPSDIAMDEKYASCGWSVFNDPLPTDIMQGYLGNCWFISSLALIAERPEILEKIILTPEYNKEGVYQVRLCIDGSWKTVVVDDLFPCYRNSKKMIFGKAQKNQLWVSIIEKGLAKICGSYAALKSGQSIEGLKVLTGAPCNEILLYAKEDEDNYETQQKFNEIWTTLISSKEANFVMGCACGKVNVGHEEFDQVCLVSNHAYSVLSVKTIDDQCLLYLRNPWGRDVWNGDWSFDWPGWTDEYKDALNYDQMKWNEGTFWIPFEMFLYYFNTITIARLRPGHIWQDLRFPINLGFHFDCKMLKMVVTKPTEICLELFQQKERNICAKVDILILVYNVPPGTNRPGELVLRSSRKHASNVCTDEKFFEPGKYMVCWLSLKHIHTGKTVPGTIVVHSSKPVIANVIDCSMEILHHSLISLALKEGKTQKPIPNFTIYSVSTKFDGMMIMVENTDNSDDVQVLMDCKESQNVFTTRGGLYMTDVIKPQHRQILSILTPIDPKNWTLYSWKSQIKQIRGSEAANSLNIPSLESVAVMALHAPVSLD